MLTPEDIRMRVLNIILLTAATVCSSVVRVDSQDRVARMAPPAVLRCDRSDLTLYDGRVLTYRRKKGSTFLRVRTSFETTEAVTIRHPAGDPSDFYLINGEAFTRVDWSRIEKRKGVLKPGVKANVWVCRGNPKIQPVVDWRVE